MLKISAFKLGNLLPAKKPYSYLLLFALCYH